MPPRVSDPEPVRGPPDGIGRVTFDVARIAAPNVAGDQLFRFSIEVINVFDVLPAGGSLKVLRQQSGPSGQTNTAPAQTLLFSVLVPNPKLLTAAERAKATYIAELVVHGRIAVKHDPSDCFSLHWARTGTSARVSESGLLVYNKKIATFTPTQRPQ